jgi:hypothetical protein
MISILFSSLKPPPILSFLITNPHYFYHKLNHSVQLFFKMGGERILQCSEEPCLVVKGFYETSPIKIHRICPHSHDDIPPRQFRVHSLIEVFPFIKKEGETFFVLRGFGQSF